MPLPFFLAGIFGKAAAAAVAKGFAGKASASAVKAVIGGHGHHGLAQNLTSEVADHLSDKAVDAVLRKREKKASRDSE